MSYFEIQKAQLHLSDLESILKNNVKLKLSKESLLSITTCREYLDEKTSNSSQPIYGINTGFGALCNIKINSSELSALQENLIKSHACGAGRTMPVDIVKLMMVLKIHALSLGNSAVRAETVLLMIELFNNEVYPVVYEYGSLGASGDLAPLAHLSLPLLGLGTVMYKGSVLPSREVLNKLGLAALHPASKEGLALLNGTQFMSATGSLALLKALRLARIADITAAISLEAYNGIADPFHPLLQNVRPHRGQKQCAANIIRLLQDSEITSGTKSQVQDPYSFRCVPQVHGASRDAINHVVGIVETEINSVTDNPTIFPDEDLILSGGNFHGQAMAMAFDYLAIALAELGNISERRVYRLISGQRGLPPFLAPEPGLNSGFMIPQYTAASIVSRNKQLCSPASVDSISSSNEQEDHVSMGANAATRLLQICDNLETLLSIEFFTATQALEFRRPMRSSESIEKIHSLFRQQVAFIANDCLMHNEMQKAHEFIKSFDIPDFVE